MIFKKKKYVVERKAVYVGTLIRPLDISVPKYELYLNSLSQEEKAEIERCDQNICLEESRRPIIFQLKNGLAEDVCNESQPRYPVESVEHAKGIKSDCIIKKAANIEALLTYLDYPELLTKKDIRKIHKMLIESSKWLEEHRNIFGYEEILDDVWLQERPSQMPEDIYAALTEIYKLPPLTRKKTRKSKIA